MTDTSTSPAVNPAAVRRKRLLLFAGGLGIFALGLGGYTWLSDGNSRSTDDAYVNGDIVAVTPQVTGTVTRIGVDNSDRVTAGTPLVEIDPTDARVELASAEADLARAVRNVRGLFATDARMNAEIGVAQANLDKARADLQQRQAIAGTGAVTGEDVRHARDAVRSAEASVTAAREARAQARALTNGTTLASHPDVQAAAERVRAAALALARVRVVAPVGGMIAQRSVQLGRRIAPGERLMAVVPLDKLWVDANFKEVQLDGICPGQTAIVTADVYGSHVTYHGTVNDIEAGSGAAFSLLPAQNATGNWIKVVQRVPVRIWLDPAEIMKHPLRIGMSTDVEVDTHSCPSGRSVQRSLPVERTTLSADEENASGQRAAAALADSLGLQK